MMLKTSFIALYIRFVETTLFSTGNIESGLKYLQMITNSKISLKSLESSPSLTSQSRNLTITLLCYQWDCQKKQLTRILSWKLASYDLHIRTLNPSYHQSTVGSEGWTDWLSMFLLKFPSKNGKVKKQLTVSCSWKLDYFSPF